MRRLLLIGGGGHCSSILDSVLSIGEYDDIGIVDEVDSNIFGISVIGKDSDIPQLVKKGWNEAFITVGSIGNAATRKKLYEMIKSYNISVATIIDPSAVIARGVGIKEGTYVGKNVVINSNSDIGICSIINTGAIIEHGCVVGDFSHISPGAILCGDVCIGKNSHIGAGVAIRQGQRIGDNTIIGMGSVVVSDIEKGSIAYGNPCKVVKK